MNKKTWRGRLVWALSILVCLAVLSVFAIPQLHYAVKGFFRGDSFFDGYPSCYYRELIIELHERYEPATGLRGFLRKWGLEFQRDPPLSVLLFPLQRDDIHSISVLNQLLTDPDVRVRLFALGTLEQIVKKSPKSNALPEMRATIPVLESLLEDRAVFYGKKDFVRTSAAAIVLRFDPGHEKARSIMKEVEISMQRPLRQR